MKFLIRIVIVILVLASVAKAQDISLTQSIRVTLDDIRETMKSITPEVKQRLESYLNSLGMNIADVEEALDNPTEDIKETFGPLGMTVSEMKKMINTLPEPIIQMFENVKEL
ncbi:hypothetical protein ACJMK2_038873 [Sinanodonta woodiana]|uniref:Uncharacterized protein n=1 Tax=Sinanodonta woodiana TaxID=1069815 RepID=A0ABD3WBQ4_SINWO